MTSGILNKQALIACFELGFNVGDTVVDTISIYQIVVMTNLIIYISVFELPLYKNLTIFYFIPLHMNLHCVQET